MRIAYNGIFQFPTGDAGAARVLGVAEALRQAGHEIVFFGIEKEVRPEDKLANGSYQYQGFTYVPSPIPGVSNLAKLRRVWGQTTGSLILDRLGKWGFSRFDAVIVYQGSSPLLWRLKKLCDLHAVACLCDVVEWYDARQIVGGAMSPLRWDSEIRMRVMQPEIGWIIAISSYLEEYYRNYESKGCRTIRIPTLINLDDPLWQPVDNRAPGNSFRLVYAGKRGKKDLLGNVLKGVSIARAAGLDVIIELLGVSQQQVYGCLGPTADRELQTLGPGIVLSPRVERTKVPPILGAADFVPLLRPDQRFAHAGFPTKIVEALSLGVPVIANLTSDLGLYLKDGYNAFLCEDEAPATFARTLQRAASAREHWVRMRDNARQTAKEHFDYRRYTVALSRFVEEAVVEARSRLGRGHGILS
jgi:glycosyltransferase involved in cell wall biosynthesis